MKLPSLTLRGFKRPREVAGLELGRLERRVMEQAWQRDEISVRDIFWVFEGRVAYTTLMTTLCRLHRKGVLNRRKLGRAFLYSPRFSAEEFERGIAKDLIEGLLDRAVNRVEPLLACIVDTVSEQDRDCLDVLDRIVRQKKRELLRKP
jgi:predicted transcriptional regulator